MNKEELVKSIVEKSQLNKENATKALDAIVATITNSLKQGEPVSLVGFGSFKVSKRAAREVRNPRTGAPISIPATTVPAFTPGKTLKEAVNCK